MNESKLGHLLLDADVITKRQLAQAVQKQVAGDKRKIGEILIDMEYLTIEDLTDIMLNNGHADKIEEMIPKSVETTEIVDISEDAVMKTKFSLDVKTMIAAATGIATLVGMWYALQTDIQEAKELPKPLPIENIYSEEYPSRPEGHNWPSSKEQYKTQVGQLGRDMDDLFEVVEELEDEIKELKKLVSDLRVDVAKKRDK